MTAAYRLYNYFRSSSSQRVRIALALKGLAYDYVPVHLVKDGGEQWKPGYLAKSPTAMVPLLEIPGANGAEYLGESVAIIQYLDEVHPEPPLMPRDTVGRARARMLAEIINAGIQPFQNLKVLGRVKKLGGDTQAWAREFIAEGLAAFQKALPVGAGRYCLGDAPTLPDLFLVPQLHAARRFTVDLAPLARLVEIDARLAELPAFRAAAPELQPDAV